VCLGDQPTPGRADSRLRFSLFHTKPPPPVRVRWLAETRAYTAARKRNT